MLTPLIDFGQVLDAPGGRAVLERHLPATLTVDPTPFGRCSSAPSCGSPPVCVTMPMPGRRSGPTSMR